MEYYIDSDPGIGSATPVSVSVAPKLDINLTIPTASLPVGFHTLVVRVQSTNGDWSVIAAKSFYISQTNLAVPADIVAMEYYIDSDPGIGSATPVSVSVAPKLDINLTIPTASLPVGFHTLVVRVQSTNGDWSVIAAKSFYISQTNLAVPADIVAMEYYIDSDPGIGNATSLGITTGNIVDFNTMIPAASLSPGYHTLTVRAMDAYGLWSVLATKSFFVDAFAADSLAGFEYFYDSDPGTGAATAVSLATPLDSLDSTFVLPTTSLAAGSHVLGIRMRNKSNVYGLTGYYNITLCDGATDSLVPDVVCVGNATTFTDASLNVQAGDVYSWDFDNDGVADASSSGNQSFAYAAAGTYTAKLTIDRAGCISTDSVQVTVEPQPVANAGADQSLCTTGTTLAAKPAAANESASWQIITGSATLSDATDSLASLTNITTDTVVLVWQVSNVLGGCSAQDTVLIIPNLPITAAALQDSVDIGQTTVVDVQAAAAINVGDVLTTTIITAPLYGAATVLSGGSIEYQPDPDAAANDQLTYRLTNQCNNFDESTIDFLVANQPPVIDSVVANIAAGSNTLTLDLTTIISDPNNNIDFSSITIVRQPRSKAKASIINTTLVIDYTGVTFKGTDDLDLQVCDLVGVCTVETITINNVDVGGELPPLRVYNGVSPNGDGYNDFLVIENIEFYPNNRVIILNRWGDKVAEFKGYNNQDVIFDDASLPAGTYYYHIVPGANGVPTLTGHFLLKTDN